MKKIFGIEIKARHRQLVSLVKDNRLRLGIAMGCSLLVSFSTAATAWLSKYVIDDIFVAHDMVKLKLLPAALLAVYVLRGIGLYGQEYFMSYVGENIIKTLRNRLYARIQDLPLSFFQKERTGALMSRITNDVQIIRGMVSDAVKAALRDVFSIIGLAIVIFWRDWKLALIASVVLPMAFYPVVEFGRRVRRVSTGCQESMADLSSFLHETFAGNKIVKAFGMESYEKKRFFVQTASLFKLQLKAVIAQALSPAVMELLAGIGVAAIIWYGGHSVISGASTPGTFFSFMAAVLLLYDPVKKLSRVNNIIQQGLAATDRVFDIIERESDITEAANAVEIKPGALPVVFENVYFKYDAGYVLKNINLDVMPGEIMALVGMSGGGKTTLVNLIPRFYDIEKGTISIAGVDIRKATLKSLRERTAIVTQDPILFNDTIRNNIAYGNPNASLAEIEKAALAAYAFDFIQRFPNKFDTTIGELGGRLSGGEKQRICIARALLKDAPILILDEATSSLDSESEMLVQKALENLMRGRTTFVIAHRLSTIGNADRIVVILQGEIVEEGTHAELMARGGEYFKLYQMQFRNGNGDRALDRSAIR
ncbi:MAG: ABC transporter ATP-binding protein [Desulfobacterales bacterium]